MLTSAEHELQFTSHAVFTRLFRTLIGWSWHKQRFSANGSDVHALSHAIHSGPSCPAEASQIKPSELPLFTAKRGGRWCSVCVETVLQGLTRAACSCTYQSSVLSLLHSLNNHHGGYNKKSQNLPNCFHGPQQDFFLRRWEGFWTDTSGSERSDACVCNEDFGSWLRKSGVC